MLKPVKYGGENWMKKLSLLLLFGCLLFLGACASTRPKADLEHGHDEAKIDSETAETLLETPSLIPETNALEKEETMAYKLEEYLLEIEGFEEVRCLKMTGYHDVVVQERINRALEDYLLSLKNDIGPANIWIWPHEQSSRFITFEINIKILGEGQVVVDNVMYLYYTVDLETGKTVLLDDLLMLDDEFFNYLRENKVLEATYPLLSGSKEEENQFARDEFWKRFDQPSSKEELRQGLCEPIRTVAIGKERNGFFIREKDIVLHINQARGYPFDFYSIPFARVEKFLKVDGLIQEKNRIETSEKIKYVHSDDGLESSEKKESDANCDSIIEQLGNPLNDLGIVSLTYEVGKEVIYACPIDILKFEILGQKERSEKEIIHRFHSVFRMEKLGYSENEAGVVLGLKSLKQHDSNRFALFIWGYDQLLSDETEKKEKWLSILGDQVVPYLRSCGKKLMVFLIESDQTSV